MGGTLSQPIAGANGTVLHSSSGQFVVALTVESAGATRSGSPSLPAGSAIRLEPAALVLTCERARQALLQEIPQMTPWQGRVYVVINPAMTNNHPALIGAKYFNQGWQYRLEVPSVLEPQKLVRGLVQVLLLELANRGLPERSAEIPLWLSEGLTQVILHSPLVDPVVQAPNASRQEMLVSNWRQVRHDPLEGARERLRTHAALSFSRMAGIDGERVAEETWKTFQASAHVFLVHLLQIPQARPALESMIRTLPYQPNWQTAFLQHFPGVFPRLLDAEKWWSVVLVQFTGLDPLNAWSPSDALQRLDDVLRPPVLVSDHRDHLPRRRRVTLQQIMGQWELVSQRLLLQNVLNQLTAIQVRIPPELSELAESYRQTLSKYLEGRGTLNRARALIGLPETDGVRLVRETREALDELDRRRAAFLDGGSPSRGVPATPGAADGRPIEAVPGRVSGLGSAPREGQPATTRARFAPGNL